MDFAIVIGGFAAAALLIWGLTLMLGNRPGRPARADGGGEAGVMAGSSGDSSGDCGGGDGGGGCD